MQAGAKSAGKGNEIDSTSLPDHHPFFIEDGDLCKIFFGNGFRQEDIFLVVYILAFIKTDPEFIAEPEKIIHDRFDLRIIVRVNIADHVTENRGLYVSSLIASISL
jgi:hypothetical protein